MPLGVTVSPSQIERVKTYVLNQEEHHRRQTFQEEYLEILKLCDRIRPALYLVTLAAPFQGGPSSWGLIQGRRAKRLAPGYLLPRGPSCAVHSYTCVDVED